MDIFRNASDDQLALMGCAVALLMCGGLMYVSYFVGQLRQPKESQEPIRLGVRRPEAPATSSEERKAA